MQLEKVIRIFKNFPIILFGILALYFLLGQNSGTYSLLEAYKGLLFALLTIVYFLALFTHSIYCYFFKKKRFDFYPLLSFFFVLAVFFILQQADNEKYKSKIILEAELVSGVDKEKYYNVKLILRENHKYSLNFSSSHYGCTEIGNYKIKSDTLSLTKTDDDCLKQVDYAVFLIDTIAKEIKLINEKNGIDTSTVFKIK